MIRCARTYWGSTAAPPQTPPPEVAAMARAVAAESPHDSELATANRRFWAERLALDAVIAERAIAR